MKKEIGYSIFTQTERSKMKITLEIYLKDLYQYDFYRLGSMFSGTY